MNRFALTRRQFHLALMTSAAALAARSKAQESPAQPADTSPTSAVNSWLPVPMPPEQAQKVAEAVKSMQKTLESLRSCPLPEGSEPAFVFHPYPLQKERR
ncbi:hypothetical protein HRbin16_03271 [bacterium HR16]|nr:hypothetical protein HRbin16_03271 [bacterium HR16]